MAAVTVTKKLVAGVPTQLLTTGALEEGSLAIEVFAPKSQVKVDIKFLASNYSIPSDRFDATNVTRTLHPGGVLDLTQNYIEETIGATAFKYMFDLKTMLVRQRDAATNLFGASAPMPITPGHLRDGDVARSRFLLSYTGTQVTLKNGSPNKFTDPNTLPTLATNVNSHSYNGNGFFVQDTAGFAISMDGNGYTSHTLNFASATARLDWSTQAGGYYTALQAPSSGYAPVQPRLIGLGSYVFVAATSTGGGGILYFMAAPISGFAANTTQAPGWASKATLTLTTSDVIANNTLFVAPDLVAEINGTALFLFNANNLLTNLTLVKAVLNGTTGAVTGTAKVTNNIDGTFKPFRIGSQVLYRKTDQSYILVDSAGTVTPYTFGILPRTLNAKTLAVNYANYGKLKLSDGFNTSDGLAYYSDGTGAYNANGQSFWCAEGKYTLVRDTSLKKLDPVGTDDDWFEQQCQLLSGARTSYSGVTLKSNLSVWAVSDKDAQIVITGYKE